jgi:hypothetical protein
MELKLFMKAITMWTRSIRDEIASQMKTMATNAKLINIIMNWQNISNVLRHPIV